MYKKLTIGLSALALTVAGAAFADNHGGMKHGGMKADANGDGVMSRAEAQTGASAMFAKMDANNDGAITDADREARMQDRRNTMFDKLDGDKNGQISRQEFMSFEHEGRKGKHHRMGKRHGGKMMMEMADANKDGRISQAEFTAAALSRFDRADADKDGNVTMEEQRAMRQNMREMHRSMKHEQAAD